MIANKTLKEHYSWFTGFVPHAGLDFTDRMIVYDCNEVQEIFYNKNNYYVLLVGNTNLHKRSMMGYLIQNLLEMGTAKSDILYIDFQFPVFFDVDIDELLRCFIENNKKKQLYLFVNEFHFIKGWHLFLTKVHAQFPQIKFIGASSACPVIYTQLNDENLDYCKIIVLSDKNNSNIKSISQGFGIYHQIKYNIKDSQIEIKGLTKEGKKLSMVEIPETIDGIPVTIIASGAFHDRSSLLKVVLPDTIKMIGDYAFARCTKLQEISLPAAVEHIGENAFLGCAALGTIETGNHIIHVGNSALYGTKWLMEQSKDFIILGNVLYCYTGQSEEIFVPKDVTSICNHAFANNKKIKSVRILNRNCIIGEGTFYGCTSLNSVSCEGLQTDIRAFAFYDCSSLKNIDFGSVSSIGDFAFCNCTELETLRVSGCLNIGNGAFYNCCSFKRFLGDAQIKSIGNGAFYKCRELRQGNFLRQTEYIGNFAFAFSGVLEVYLDSIKKLESFAFYDCENLKKVSIAQDAQIDQNVFEGCINIESMQISGNNTLAHLFGGMRKISSQLGIIEITGESIVDNFCRGCHNLLKLIISSDVKQMGRWAFYECENLNEIMIKKSLTRVSDWAFAYCNGIKKITLPLSILEIGMNAFRYCNNLREIVIEASEQVVKLEVNAFYSTPEDKKIIVQEKMMTGYQNDRLWHEYKHLIRIG